MSDSKQNVFGVGSLRIPDLRLDIIAYLCFVDMIIDSDLIQIKTLSFQIRLLFQLRKESQATDCSRKFTFFHYAAGFMWLARTRAVLHRAGRICSEIPPKA
jgi:hypothetical protein